LKNIAGLSFLVEYLKNAKEKIFISSHLYCKILKNIEKILKNIPKIMKIIDEYQY
jgi:hypothetical protein